MQSIHVESTQRGEGRGGGGGGGGKSRLEEVLVGIYMYLQRAAFNLIPKGICPTPQRTHIQLEWYTWSDEMPEVTRTLLINILD